MTKEKFKEIWIPYISDFHKLASMILKSEAMAKDVVQDVFIKLWERKDKLHEIKSPKAYGLTLTRNRCLDRLRTQKLHKNVDDIQIASSLDCEDIMLKKERLKLLKKLLNDLPDVQKEVARLRFFEEKDYKEIASITGLSSGSLRTMIHRIKVSIKSELEQFS